MDERKIQNLLNRGFLHLWSGKRKADLNLNFFFILLLLFNLSLISAGMLCCSNTALDFHWVCGKQGLSARFSLTLHTNTLISLHSPKFQMKFSHTNTLNPACASLCTCRGFSHSFPMKGMCEGQSEPSYSMPHFTNMVQIRRSPGLLQLLELCTALEMLQILHFQKRGNTTPSLATFVLITF